MLEFEELRVTMMTCHMKILDDINIENLYITFNCDENIKGITYLGKLKGEKSKKKKKKDNQVNTYLKNHVLIYFYYKNINIKISKQSLTIVGAKNKKDIKYICDILLNKINKVNKYICILNENIDYIIENYKHIHKISRGSKIHIKKNNTYDYVNDNREWEIDNKLIEKILYYFYSNFKYSSEFLNFLLWIILNYNKIYETQILLDKVNISMINRIFNIGYQINLDNFSKVFHIPDENYYMMYIRSLTHKARIKYVYYKEYVNKKLVVKCITITIESSGSITISGPYLKITEELYYDFMEKMLLFENYIKLNIKKNTKDIKKICIKK